MQQLLLTFVCAATSTRGHLMAVAVPALRFRVLPAGAAAASEACVHTTRGHNQAIEWHAGHVCSISTMMHLKVHHAAVTVHSKEEVVFLAQVSEEAWLDPTPLGSTGTAVVESCCFSR